MSSEIPYDELKHAAAMIWRSHNLITWDAERDDPEEMARFHEFMDLARDLWPWLDEIARESEEEGEKLRNVSVRPT